MTVKYWLNRIRYLNNEIRQLEEELKEAEERAAKITSSADGAIVSGSKDPHSKMESIIEAVDNLVAVINRQKTAREEARAEILEAIDTIEDSRTRKILNDYYFRQKKVRAIALDEFMSEQNVYKILRAGTTEIEKYKKV